MDRFKVAEMQSHWCGLGAGLGSNQGYGLVSWC